MQYRDAGWKMIFDTRTKVVVSSSNNGLRCVPASGSTCTYCTCLMIAWFELFQQLDKTTLKIALITFSSNDPSDEFIADLHSHGPTDTSTFFASLVSNLSAGGCKCPSQRCWAMITEAKLLLQAVEAFPLFSVHKIRPPDPLITKTWA